VNVPNVNDGTPQSNGSVATPVMPARPAMSCWNAKSFSVLDVVRPIDPLIACTERPARMLTVTGRLKVAPRVVPLNIGNTLACSPRFLR
jgi:hypothetical protein